MSSGYEPPMAWGVMSRSRPPSRSAWGFSPSLPMKSPRAPRSPRRVSRVGRCLLSVGAVGSRTSVLCQGRWAWCSWPCSDSGVLAGAWLLAREEARSAHHVDVGDAVLVVHVPHGAKAKALVEAPQVVLGADADGDSGMVGREEFEPLAHELPSVPMASRMGRGDDPAQARLGVLQPGGQDAQVGREPGPVRRVPDAQQVVGAGADPAPAREE